MESNTVLDCLLTVINILLLSVLLEIKGEKDAIAWGLVIGILVAIILLGIIIKDSLLPEEAIYQIF